MEDQWNISDKSFRFRHSSQPFFQNIFGSVMIPVVFRTAVRAYPGAAAQIFCIFVLIATDGAIDYVVKASVLAASPRPPKISSPASRSSSLDKSSGRVA